VEFSCCCTKRKKTGVVLGVVLLVLLAGGGVGGYFIFKPNTGGVTNGNVNTGNNGTNTNTATPETNGTLPGPVKAELNRNSGGKFQMGRMGATAFELPVHTVTVQPSLSIRPKSRTPNTRSL